MLHFATSYMKRNKSRKQTLESAQYGLEISFNFSGRCSRQEPTCIKININIKLTNGNKIVMLSQTHGYDQFVRFPKTVKSIN